MRLVTVCAWCPDGAARTASEVARGNDVTHGMCPTCAAAFEGEPVITDASGRLLAPLHGNEVYAPVPPKYAADGSLLAAAA